MRVVRNREISRGSRAIVFGRQRPSEKRHNAGRLFASVRNNVGRTVESATSNPRAILRMVSGYC
jgi:hypothetical protein